MEKIWILALFCAALSTSACLTEESCTLIGCDDAIRIKLNDAAGALTGTLTVNGQAYEIKTADCDPRQNACTSDDGVFVETDIFRVDPALEMDVTIDVTATASGVTRSAAQTVMIQRTSSYPNGEDCGECLNHRGEVTLQ